MQHRNNLAENWWENLGAVRIEMRSYANVHRLVSKPTVIKTV